MPDSRVLSLGRPQDGLRAAPRFRAERAPLPRGGSLIQAPVAPSPGARRPPALPPSVARASSGPVKGPSARTGSAGPRSARAGGPLDLAARLRAFERVVRGRVRRRDALVEMLRAVNATLDPESLASLIIDRASSWIPAPCWALVSADLSGHLSLLADRGLAPELGAAVYAIAEWVMRHDGEFASADLGADARVAAAGLGAVLGLPLTARGRRVGALVAADRTAASRPPRLAPDLLRAIRLLLEPAAAALDNALLLKRAEALSVTDDLTRLYNSRYLNLALRREAKRAFRTGRPVSLVFLDLDGFKSINDTHGHLSGSRALVEAAAVVKGSARETDVVARFGGDEFALVLPDTGSEGALAVGERIRRRIEAHRFLASDGLDIRLTASFGVATLPDVARSPEELVHAADAAMYQVKQRGKNGIQAAAPGGHRP